MKIQTFTIKGNKKEEISLPKEFAVKINLPLLAQAIYVYEERSHVGLRKTKTRAEVERTTKKLYRQKGTGGARHGSRRAPIFVGGGVALGPRPLKRKITLSNAIKNKSKLMAFSLKAEEKQLAFISGLSKIEKTKDAAALFKTLQKETGIKKFTLILSEAAKSALKSFRNLANIKTFFYKDVNALDIYKGGMVVVDDEIFANNKDNKEGKSIKSVKTAKGKTSKKTKKKVTKAAKNK